MSSESKPKFWKLLSDEDQITYKKIQDALSQPSLKNKRNTKIDDFTDIIDAIEMYQNHNMQDKWRRCLACGFLKFDGGVAVNTSQLRILVLRCKTSINTSLKGMGYTIISGRASDCEELLNEIPCLKGNPSELRQWTVRYYAKPLEDENQSYISPPLPSIEEAAMSNMQAASSIKENETFEQNMEIFNQWEDFAFIDEN